MGEDSGTAVKLIVLLVFIVVCVMVFGIEGSANDGQACQAAAVEAGYGHLETRIHWGDCQVLAGVIGNGKHVWKNLESMPEKEAVSH